jgi:tRNA(Ile)-lysidine synthase
MTNIKIAEGVIKKFQNMVRLQGFWNKGDRLLVGISGGPDSVVLAHLSKNTGLPIGLAHVNYGLRGEDSEQDELLVTTLATSWDVPVYIKRVDTKKTAKERQTSLQETAREIRYQWWAELIETEGYSHILTGHQAEDQVETILLALMRGSGLSGMQGIPVRRGTICRPMLGITREEIMAYIDVFDLPFRLDASNLGDDYLRNKLRHTITPLMESLRPGLAARVAANSLHVASGLQAAKWAVTQIKPEVFHELKDGFTLKLSKLQRYPFSSFALFTLLTPYGFTPQQIENMLLLDEGSSGQQFLTHVYRLVHDRGRLLCSAQNPAYHFEPIPLEPKESHITTPIGSLVLTLNRAIPDQLSGDPNILFIDTSAIKGHMVLRLWEPGDKFHPLGMHGRQKVKTLLTDRKLDRHTKDKTLVLTVDETIWWVLGLRIAENARIFNAASTYLMCSWHPAINQPFDERPLFPE